MFKIFTLPRRALSSAPVLALLVTLAPSTDAAAQAPQATPQAPAPAQQATPPAAAPAGQTETQLAAGTAAARETAKPRAAEPLYREYRGVALGMSASDVRARLGKPQEKSDEMDFFVFNERERARVYYREGKASAVIATYIGKDAPAPKPSAVLGAEVEAKPDGSMYRMTPYPQAGYWVAYSRTPGEQPLVIITMQKTP